MDDGGCYEEDEDGVRWKVFRGRFKVVVNPIPLQTYCCGRFSVTVWDISGLPPRRRRARCSTSISSVSGAACVNLITLECPSSCDISEAATGVNYQRPCVMSCLQSFKSHGMPHSSQWRSHDLVCSPTCSAHSWQQDCSSRSDLPFQAITEHVASRCHSPAPAAGVCKGALSATASVPITPPKYLRCDSSSSSNSKSYGSTTSLGSFLEDSLFSPASDRCNATLHWHASQCCWIPDWDPGVSAGGIVKSSSESTVKLSSPLPPKCMLQHERPAVTTSNNCAALFSCRHASLGVSQSPGVSSDSGIPKRRGRFRIYEGERLTVGV